MSRVAQHRETTGRMLVVAATLLWSTSGIFAKAPFLAMWDPVERGYQLAFWRAAFATLVLLPWIRRPRWTWRLVPAIVSFAAMNTTFLLAMTTTTEANAIWLQYTAPLWVFVVSVGIWHERSDARDVLMLLLGLLGVAIIVIGESWRSAGASHPQGVMWGLASGVGFAGVVLSIRTLRDLDGAWVIALCHALAAAALLPHVVGTQQWPQPKLFAWLACFGALQMALPYLLFARGTRYITGHEAAFLALLEPLLVPVWAYVVWRHTSLYTPPATWTILGAALILAGILLKYARRPLRPPT